MSNEAADNLRRYLGRADAHGAVFDLLDAALAHERSAGAAPLAEKRLVSEAYTSGWSIPDLTAEEAEAFDVAMAQSERSAGAAPLDVEVLAVAIAACGYEAHPVDIVRWADEIAAEYARLLD